MLSNGNSPSETDPALMRTPLRSSGPYARQEKIVRIAALYDAILLGMRDYIARHQQCASFIEDSDPWDPASLYHALVRAGVFDDPLMFNRFSLIVERALWQESFPFDADKILTEAETMLIKLGVVTSL